MEKIKLLLSRIYYWLFPKKVNIMLDDLVNDEMKKSYDYHQKEKEERDTVRLRTAKKFFKHVEPCESDHQHKWICNLHSQREKDLEVTLKHLKEGTFYNDKQKIIQLHDPDTKTTK